MRGPTSTASGKRGHDQHQSDPFNRGVEFIRPQNTSLTGSLPLSMAARNAS